MVLHSVLQVSFLFQVAGGEIYHWYYIHFSLCSRRLEEELKEANMRIQEEQRQKEELLATPQVIHVTETEQDETVEDDNLPGGKISQHSIKKSFYCTK